MNDVLPMCKIMISPYASFATGTCSCSMHVFLMQAKFSDAVSHHPLLQSLSRCTAWEKPLSS
ncbi:unnamed protein product [Callosobruchus maculatus]|uniref:Uncharacterized protein n=1 Tax=Callosobruchus maculatus TaxID=64391 RepID=A0A653DXR5_CALMS|nr:unnamed protein product [Callosobruchus maculatus]